MKWYIVQSYSGFEKKVSEQIKEELSKAGMVENFGDKKSTINYYTFTSKSLILTFSIPANSSSNSRDLGQAKLVKFN